jgi:hypothetical protein
MAFWDFIKPLMIKAPEVTYFDHLAGEFESLATAFAAEPPAPAPTPGAEAAAHPSEAGPTAPDAATPQTGGAADEGADDSADDSGGGGSGAAAAETRPTETARRVFAEARRTVARLKRKRDEKSIDWNDLYLFEMLLADVRPAGSLRSKVLSLRRDYRSVAGQVEYDEYLASKPKNLLDPPDPRDPPDADANYEQLMRSDLKDLLGRLFKRYAILPVREARLKRLTIWASLICGAFLLLLLLFVVSMSWIASEQQQERQEQQQANSNASREAQANANANANMNANADANENANRAAGQTAAGAQRGGRSQPLVPSIALFVVLVSGAMGGFVSALQRIQSSPTEGDSIYNLAMLYHGSYAVFVAPLTGAVFAILLYMMFTGKILEGRFFPDIYTPSAATVGTALAPAATPEPTPEETPTPKPSPTPTPTPAPRGRRGRAPAAPADAQGGGNANSNSNAVASGANANNSNANNSNANAAGAGGVDENASDGSDSAAGPAATPTAKPTPRQVPTKSVRVKDFLYDSGPAGGQDYALLIIWSFIAGFAERFVPDSLNRLIDTKR